MANPWTASDARLKQRIGDALDLLPAADVARLAIVVDRGAVTLYGAVEDEAHRAAALDAALHVTGVHAIADETKLRTHSDAILDAEDIARTVGAALGRAATDVTCSVQAVVSGQSVCLSGTVAHACDRDTAARAAWYVNGVQSLENHIVVVPA